MILDTPSKSIQAFLAAAVTTTPLAFTADLTVVASGASQTVTGSITGPTPVVVVPAPTTGTAFKVAALNVFNADSVASVLTLALAVSAILTTWYQATLQPGDNLFYQASSGSFYVIARDGSVRGITPLPFGAATEASVLALTAALGLQGTTYWDQLLLTQRQLVQLLILVLNVLDSQHARLDVTDLVV